MLTTAPTRSDLSISALYWSCMTTNFVPMLATSEPTSLLTAPAASGIMIVSAMSTTIARLFAMLARMASVSAM